MDELVENLLCEGGDVEQWLEPRNKFLVFAFDPLSLTLSIFTLCLASFLLLIHLYMLGCVGLCASLVFNHESFI